MLECIVLGDSIAVGTYQFAKECQLLGRSGINTGQWNKMYPTVDLTAGVVIISLGTNDHKYVKTVEELEKMRTRVVSKRVFWVLPAGTAASSELPVDKLQAMVTEIAQKNGDTVLPIRGLQADGIHPSWSGYKDIVARTKE